MSRSSSAPSAPENPPSPGRFQGTWRSRRFTAPANAKAAGPESLAPRCESRRDPSRGLWIGNSGPPPEPRSGARRGDHPDLGFAGGVPNEAARAGIRSGCRLVSGLLRTAPTRCQPIRRYSAGFAQPEAKVRRERVMRENPDCARHARWGQRGGKGGHSAPLTRRAPARARQCHHV